MARLLGRNKSREVTFDGRWFFEITPISAYSVAKSGDRLPFTIFDLEKVDTSPGYSTYKERLERNLGLKTQEEKESESHKFILGLSCVRYFRKKFLTIESSPLNLDAYCGDSGNIFERRAICSLILAMSFKVFKHQVKFKRDFIISIADMAKSYGKTPIEILLPSGGYNDLDALCFNDFCHSIFVQTIANQEQ